MAEINVRPEGSDTFLVTVQEGETRTTHTVTVRPSDVTHYVGEASPEALVEASFRFLLARESKESILARFDLPVIERYFPEYPDVIRGLL